MSCLKAELVARSLAPTYVDEHAYQIALLLLQKVTGYSRTELLTMRDLTLSSSAEQQLAVMIDDIVNRHMPVQYIWGTVPFLGLTLAVRPPILIPRPETEEWCARVIAEYASSDQVINLLDIGTGSGCLALACAQALPRAQVTGVDLSPLALDLARHNALINGLTQVRFMESDLFSAVTEVYDVILANPPYIAPEEYASLDKEVRYWEDERALVAADQGLQVIRRLVQEAPRFLSRERGWGHLWCEIGYKQAASVVALFKQTGFSRVEVMRDMAGKDRVVWGVL